MMTRSATSSRLDTKRWTVSAIVLKEMPGYKLPYKLSHIAMSQIPDFMPGTNKLHTNGFMVIELPLWAKRGVVELLVQPDKRLITVARRGTLQPPRRPSLAQLLSAKLRHRYNRMLLSSYSVL